MNIYQPGEDTFLILEHLEKLDLQGKKVLDMGTGSGIIALKAARNKAEVTAVDKNKENILYAKKQAQKEKMEEKIEFIQSNLFKQIKGEYDYIFFNPPYLPGEGYQDDRWEGGEKGIETTISFLEKASNYLTSQGDALVIASSSSDLETLQEKFQLEKLEAKKLWFETLYLFKSD